MRNFIAALTSAFVLVVTPALADWTGKDASSATITFLNPNTCSSVACVPTAQLVNAAGGTLLGTAGTANAGVLTVQGIASMTPFLAAQSGTWSSTVTQATAANLNATVVGTGTFAVQATQAGMWNIGSITTLPALPANQSTNEAQINGVTPLMGNGVTGTGSQRVTIASDNTAFSVNATLQASSATAIGTVNPTTPANWGIGATGSAVPANAVLGMMSNAGTGVALQGDGTNGLWVNIKAGAGSGGTALADNAAWTAGTTNMTPMGCEFTSGGATAITTGHAATVGCTSARAAFTDLEAVAGTSLAAAVSAYGTAPTGTAVMGVNAFITNTNANLATNADGVTAVSSATAGAGSPTNSTNYIFNGTTFDRQRSGGATGVAAVAGAAAAGSATAGNPVIIGATGSGNATTEIVCDSSVVYDASTSGETQLVALSSGKTIYVCGYAITAGASATNVNLAYGTGTACAAGTTKLTPAFQAAANGGLVDHASNHWGGMKTAASNALCINTSAANAVQAVVYYTQF